MEWVVLAVAIAALAVVIFAAVYMSTSERSRTSEAQKGVARQAEKLTEQPGLPAADPLLPPVLLPEDPVAEDIDKVRFAVGFNGYRVEEVDDFLDKVRDELTLRNQRIAELEARLGARGATAAAKADEA